MYSAALEYCRIVGAALQGGNGSTGRESSMKDWQSRR